LRKPREGEAHHEEMKNHEENPSSWPFMPFMVHPFPSNTGIDGTDGMEGNLV
jgi:hypothetical protein